MRNSGTSNYKNESGLKLQTVFEGQDMPHRLMWSIVEEQAALAKNREQDWSNPSLIAMIFSFHALEAYLNFVGLRLAPEIWKDEREHFGADGFKKKLRTVIKEAGLPWEPGKRPTQTVLGLQKLRNAIAHGKPENRSGKVLHDQDTEAPYLSFSLRAMFTPKGKMPKTVADVQQLAKMIHNAVSLKINSDASFGKEPFYGPVSSSHWITTKSEKEIVKFR